ncbi:Peptide deformylase [Pseudomonas syringae pv. actinidiae]|uniref:Peptide deformylase n=1 Tax=Pseudomonas syringae pv. actinidiae TaxID=103796 RepID=A0A2V0QJJ8_PSESF|nr:Peptide deformylase [Pseudomonas syringae pv. actinidiae]
MSQAVIRQCPGFFTQYPINHIGEGLVAQHLTRLRHQSIVGRVNKRQRKQALEMLVQLALSLCMPGITN